MLNNHDIKSNCSIQDNVKYKVSTITLSGKYINCDFDLYNVGKYLQIDENIIGIKYNYCNDSILKGIYQTASIKKIKKKVKHVNKILFYNQISIIIKYDNNQINLKLFKNGSIQITGCKKISNINNYLTILYEKLLKLQDKTHEIILTRHSNNLLLDSNNYIYEFNNHIYESNTLVLESNNHINNHINESNKISRNIKNKVNYKVVGYRINNQNIYSDPLYSPNISKENIDMIKIIDYDTSPFKNVNYYKNCQYEINIDCINVCINMNTTLNLYKLYQYFIDNEYICKYNPETYSGIKFMYKINYNTESNENNGKCKCKNKCICTTCTFLIFQTGNIICTGFKSFTQMEKTLIDFVNLMYLQIN